MNSLKNLSIIKELYKKGENIIQYLKNANEEQLNTPESILISYDLQAGSYTENYKNNKEFIEHYSSHVARVIEKYTTEFETILEAGVGEATTLGNVLKFLKHKPSIAYGFDISWSRIKYAMSFINNLNIDNCSFFTGDLFNIPLKDNAIDIVYTSHSIEPNGGKEKEALQELYRITKNYLILLEPCYELANNDAKERMFLHGYITQLQKTIIELNYEVLEFRIFDLYVNPLNPTGLTVIKKKSNADLKIENPFACPISKTELKFIRGSYFSKESLLAYPVVDNVLCLLPSNAIVATHYLDQKGEE